MSILVPPWLPRAVRPVGQLPQTGTVRLPQEPVEVSAEVAWTDGSTTTVRGWARAWTPAAVLVEWYGPGWRHWKVWLPRFAVTHRSRPGT